jgi:SAM-dependent methyltransferase
MIEPLKSTSRYDTIGRSCSYRRKEDPLIAKVIEHALGSAKSVINVGAGSGSYEPKDRNVVAIEPSQIMIQQRPLDSLPAIRAHAEALPFHDRVFDAAMTVLSVHHWDPYQKEGIQEMKRVARDRVVVVTIDPRVSGKMWLMSDCLPEVAELDNKIFPFPETISGWLDCEAKIDIIPVNRDTPDWFLLSFWAHPERILDETARASTSGFARQAAEVVERVVSAVSRDLESGEWERRYGHLRKLPECDVGLRLITGFIS